MAQKLITFAVPCYNSAAYMRHCIETLLSAGEQAEIILVDDGSTKDDTPAICDEYAAKYPTIVKAVHRPVLQGSGQRRLAGRSSPQDRAGQAEHADCPGHRA